MKHCYSVRTFLALIAVAALRTLQAAEPTTTPPQGLRDATPGVHALVGARIVVSPGVVIEQGTLVARDGTIEAVGADVKPPADARLWDASGKTIYPALFDAFAEQTRADGTAAANGPGYWNSQVTPQERAEASYRAETQLNEKLRGQGIALRLVAPAVGIVRGTSAVVTTGDGDGARLVIKNPAALHLKLSVARGANRDRYPNSPMGAVALVRQALLDASWYAKAWDVYDAHSGLARPERNVALEALSRHVAAGLPVVIDADDELYFLRADRLGKEFGLNVIVRGSGAEYRRLDAIRATGRAVIVPLGFPKAPDVSTAAAALSAPLEELLDWDLAPENPARLDKAGVRIALTTHGLDDPGKFLAAVRKAVERGLPAEAALKALTTTPASLYGLEERVGTLAAGKGAHFIVTDGDLFAKKTHILDTWVDGRRYEVQALPDVDLRGTWKFTATAADGQSQLFKLLLAGEPWKVEAYAIEPADGEPALASKLKQARYSERHFDAALPGKQFGKEGVVQLSATLSGAAEDPARFQMRGTVLWPDGSQSTLVAERIAPFDEKEATALLKKLQASKPPAKQAGDQADAAEPPPEKPQGEAEPEKKEEAAAAEGNEAEEPKAKPALFDVNYPLGAFGVAGPPQQPQAVLFKNATVWTCGPEGIINGGSVLVVAGRIARVGVDIVAPADAVVVDLAGKHVTPGIIDCHSHIATDGGVNETGQAITAEVRIGDFIDPNDINIYRQLAGGVTASNILHGSANPIGGQNQVIKLRWGALPEEMKFEGAPPGIKFALGENVKQSNWGDRFSDRYPQTRMGVEQLIRDEFEAARRYQQHKDEWGRNGVGLPPRIDLELEAIAEVLAGKRLIHCHSYRQDEILALLRTCEAFGVRVATLQHILEGYKVADAMAKHGVGGSSFSDWWAYKFEVIDAIPYNGAILHKAGVVVSFNSDDAELARRLNLEAAKAVKYGGVPPEEALKFVSLNAAKQLQIDPRVGSLEPGKDADLVVWSGSPLSTYSHAEQTWIDGRKYFDRAADLVRRDEVRKMRMALVQKILASPGEMAGPGETPGRKKTLWPREDIFCGHHGHESMVDHAERE